jgi:hypothetical protein
VAGLAGLTISSPATRADKEEANGGCHGDIPVCSCTGDLGIPVHRRTGWRWSVTTECRLENELSGKRGLIELVLEVTL